MAAALSCGSSGWGAVGVAIENTKKEGDAATTSSSSRSGEGDVRKTYGVKGGSIETLQWTSHETGIS